MSTHPYRTQAVRTAIIHAVTLGLSLQNAAHYAGIDFNDLFAWMKVDPNLKTDMDQARAKSKMLVVASLMEQIKNGNFPAMVFWLRSRCPEFRDIHTSSKWDAEGSDDTVRVVWDDSEGTTLIEHTEGPSADGNDQTPPPSA